MMYWRHLSVVNCPAVNQDTHAHTYTHTCPRAMVHVKKMFGLKLVEPACCLQTANTGVTYLPQQCVKRANNIDSLFT